MDNRDKIVAYHEAGHAVVAWTQRLKVFRASIAPDQGSLGYVIHADSLHPGDLHFRPRSIQTRVAAERNLRVALAGEATQRIVDPRSLRVPFSSDRIAAKALLSQLHGDANQEVISTHLRLIELEVESLVRKNWFAIDAVATALQTKKNLSGRQILRVIKQSAKCWGQ